MNKHSFNGKCRFYLRPEYVKNVTFKSRTALTALPAFGLGQILPAIIFFCKFANF